MKKPLWLTLLFILLAAVLVWLPRQFGLSHGGNQFIASLAKMPATPIPGTSTQIKPRLLGKVKVREGDEMTKRVAATFANHSAHLQNSVAPLPCATNTDTHGPKQPNLSEAQRHNLAKLRWGPTKSLRYRGDGEDATVRLLAAPALILPKDPANPKAESPEAMTKRFLSENRDLLLIKNPLAEFTISSVEKQTRGDTVLRLSQKLGNLEVWPGQITANVSEAGYLTVITGAYAPTPEGINTTPVITPEQAKAAALQHVNIDASSLSVTQPPVLKIFADKGRVPELSYEVQVEGVNRHERVFVSAQTGNVLTSISEICTGAMIGTGTDTLGYSRSLNVYSNGSPVRYYLVDASKPMYNSSTGNGYIGIYNAADALNLSFSTQLNSGYDAEGVGASFNMGKVYDFYKNIFGRNSYDNNGSSIIAMIRKTNPDGSPMANANWSGADKQMSFGTADRYTAATDVVGHEYTHAVVNTTANLVYKDEPGALNESLADIFGEAIERAVYGTNDWLIGSFLSVGGPIRSMKNPEIFKQPYKMSQYLRTSADHGGVHTNSGIPNKAFYMLVEGLSTGGIGFDPARNIFYRTLVTKLNANSDFIALREGCILSAEELYGVGSTQETKVRAAFDAVEIYDTISVGMPSDLTPAAGADSYLLSYLAVDNNYYLGRREAALGDGNGVVGISGYPVDPNTRPSVSGDGSQAVFVSSTFDLVCAQTNGSGSSALGYPGQVYSTSMSADSNVLVFIKRNISTGLPINEISYINVLTGVTKSIPLYLPIADGGTSITINSIDEIDLSPDGQTAIFDGLAQTTLGDGTVLSGWSIFAVDLASSAIYSLAGPYNGVDIGNPSFARTSSNRMVFESVSTTDSRIISLSFEPSNAVIVKTNGSVSNFYGYPRFSAADNFIVFTEEYFDYGTFTYRPRVVKLSLLADHLSPTGSETILQYLAINGLSYRRGTFAGAPVLSVSTTTPTVVGGSSGSFRISRISGDQAIRVPISFKALGTARSDIDYTRINLTASLAPNVSYVDIPVSALLNPNSATCVLTLSLDPHSHYLLASPGSSSTINLVAPAMTFSYWAGSFGVGAATDDPDGDGLKNLLEYAIGSNPTQADVGVIQPGVRTVALQTFLEVAIKRSLIRSGVTWTLERSSDLIQWQQASVAVVTDTSTLLVLRDTLPIDGVQRRFLRVKANVP